MDKVTLPHYYIISQVPCEEYNEGLGFFKYGNAWYKTHLYFGDKEKSKWITIQFDGDATHATVYFNGSVLKHNYFSHNPFEVDITDFIRFGEDNVLAVYINTKSVEGGG